MASTIVPSPSSAISPTPVSAATKLELFIENSNDLIVTVAADLTVIDITPNCERLLGHSAFHLRGRSWLSLLDQTSVAQAQQDILQAQTDAPIHFSWRIRHQLGYYLWIDASCEYVSAENIWLIYVRDISEQREVEIRLATEREQTQLLNDSTTHLISRHTADGRFIFASPAANVLLGIADDDLIGLELVDLVHPEDLVRLQRKIDLLPLNSEIQTVTYRVRHRQGYYVWFESQLRRTGDDERPNLIIISRDITPLKQAQLQMRQQTRQLIALEEMGKAVTATLELDEVLTRVLKRLSQIITAEGLSILTRRDDSWEIIAANGVGGEDYVGKQFTNDSIRSIVEVRRASVVSAAALRDFAPDGLDDEAQRWHWRSLIVAPLRVNDNLVGVVTGVHRQPDAFDDTAVDLIEMASHWAAIAIENSRVVDTLRNRTEQLAAQNTLGRTVTASLNLDTVLARVLDQLLAQISAENIAILLPTQNEWEVVASSGIAQLLYIGDRYSSDAFPAVLNQRETIVVSTTSDGDEIPRTGDERDTTFPWRSMIVGPLQVGDTLVGIIGGVHRQPDAFNESDAEFLKLSTLWAAAAIDNARLYERLKRRGQQLQQLTKKVVEVQEAERARLSRELHDESGQSLTALRINLGFLRDSVAEFSAEIAAQFDDVLDLTQQTMQRMSRLARSMHPVALERAGLNDAVAGLCRDFQRHTKIKVNYSGTEADFDESAAITIYRFVQEALTNAGKYAKASQIDVTCNSSSESFVIRVADNGIGMRSDDPNELSDGKSLGLVGMRERLVLLGGKLAIETVQGKGSALIATLPLANNQNDAHHE